jgi:hypothetical protein
VTISQFGEVVVDTDILVRRNAFSPDQVAAVDRALAWQK